MKKLLCALLFFLGCHEPTSPVKPCGYIADVWRGGYDVVFRYETRKTPNFFRVRFKTDRPDTVRVNDSICFTPKLNIAR